MNERDDDRSRTLREEEQAAALREVADIGEQRAALLRQADALLEPLATASVKAMRLGAPKRRTQELAQVGTTAFYRWMEQAGLPVRTKRPAKTGRRPAANRPGKTDE